MRILLFGAAGQVGFALQRALSPLGDVIPATRSGTLPGGAPCCRVDLATPGSAAEALTHERPQIVVNAAAYTAVDRAEDEPELAYRINADAVGEIGRWCAAQGALLVHYSTDYVFDGRGTRPYVENDRTAPLGVYGRSKLAGEEAVLESDCRHLIFRTAWVYAARGGNFLRTMLRLAGERDELRIVDDQRGAPTPAHVIAAATAAALARGAALPGTYHLAASGECTWFGFARALFAAARVAGLIAKSPQLEAISSDQYPTRAERPRYSRLDCTRFRRDFSLELPDWRDGLRDVISELADRRVAMSPA